MKLFEILTLVSRVKSLEKRLLEAEMLLLDMYRLCEPKIFSPKLAERIKGYGL